MLIMKTSSSVSIPAFSDKAFGNFLNSMPQPTVMKDRQHRWVAVNDAFCQWIGCDRQQLIGKTDQDIFPAEVAQQFWDEDESVFATGIAQQVETLLSLGQTGNGRVAIQRFQFQGDQELTYIINQIRCLPAQVATTPQPILQSTHATSRALVEAIPDLLIQMRADGTYLDLAFEGGYKPTAIAATPGKNLFDCLPMPVAEQRMYYVQQALATGKLQIHNQELLIENQLVYEEVRIIPTGVDEVLVMIRDVTDRRRAEIELQELNEQLESQVEARTAALRKVVSRLEAEISDRKKTEIALQQSETQLRQQKEELKQTLKDLQQTQMKLIQSEKMSGLGQLVAGVAHEINNPVNFIYGNLTYADGYTRDLLNLVQLYQQHYPTPVPAIQREVEAVELSFLIEDLPKLLNSIKIGAERIQKIVASLRTFSRMDEAEMKSVSLPECLDSTLMILQNRIKSKPDRAKIEVIKKYADLPQIECYAGQLNQVFMNIISNAIDALEDRLAKEKAEPTSTTHYIPNITIQLTQPNPQRVKIIITDNGSGIPESIQTRIFDPFFTTKPIGRGTGMGLSISYQIITEKHRGLLTCNSTSDIGTQFIIEIPVKQAIAS